MIRYFLMDSEKQITPPEQLHPSSQNSTAKYKCWRTSSGA